MRGLRVLFDLVHPANILFFFHSIRRLEQSGAQVRIASRHKDVLVPLLDEFGFDHEPLSRAGNGSLGLARELVRRDLRLWRLARKFRPQVMVGYGGVAISHVGTLTGIPSLSFYDTEHAAVQNRLTLPFITEWHVPESWRGPEAPGRTFRFSGGKQFAYLHPRYFQPSSHEAVAAGLDPKRDNFLLRTVEWRAAHDRGRSGMSQSRLYSIVDFLAARGKVHISAEGALPTQIEAFRYRGTPGQFHHLLAHCRLYCGESITIASEAVMLGVPVLLQIDKEYGYVAEQRAAGLIGDLPADGEPSAALGAALDQDQDAYREKCRNYVEGKADMNAYVLEQIERLATSGRRLANAR